ncbi:hypothetical protein VZT92_015889 [Zoarces viviparus]|uniref:Uncharacterized protein n=1 Tax=Zoarces viviparus TaxID=48416 RepID=A0AAW1EX28_ZOAVI
MSYLWSGTGDCGVYTCAATDTHQLISVRFAEEQNHGVRSWSYPPATLSCRDEEEYARSVRCDTSHCFITADTAGPAA